MPIGTARLTAATSAARTEGSNETRPDFGLKRIRRAGHRGSPRIGQSGPDAET